MSSDITPSQFVGRRRELSELRSAVADARQGRGHLFLIGGEPGIGKTCLADEVSRSACESGLMAVWGRCWEGGGAPAYWPWVQLTRAYVRERSLEHLVEHMRRAGAVDLVHLLPELRERLPEVSTTLPAEPAEARFRLFEAMHVLLRAATAEQPMLVVLDDLHASDADSLRLLRYLARELRTLPLLVIGTYRDVEAQQTEAAAELILELVREGTHLPLRGLSEGDVRSFIEQALAAEVPNPTGVGPTPELIAAVYRITEGNPFFVGEVVRLWIAEGRFAHPANVVADSSSVPAQVREAVRRRLRLLSEPARDVLAVAAVIGREFDLCVLDRLLDGPQTPAVSDLLAEARSRAVLSDAARGAPSRYAFAHALFRETLYQDLSPTRAGELHRRIGGIIVELYHDNLDAHCADVAHHFFLAAAAGGPVDEAIVYAVRAAERATAMRAYDDAVDHYSRALQALDLRRPTAMDAGGSAAERCRVLLALGTALNAAGDRARARQGFQQAADLARRIGHAELFARAALGHGGSWIRLVQPGPDVLGPVGLDETLPRLLAEALERLGDDNPALRAQLLTHLAVERFFTASSRELATMAEEGVTLARRASDPLTLAGVLNEAIVATWGPDTLDQRRTMVEELLGLVKTLDAPALEMMGVQTYVTTLFERGECEVMEPEFGRLCRLAQHHRQQVHLWSVMSYRAMLALVRGHFDEARRWAHEALEIGGATNAGASMVYTVQMAALHRDRGEIDKLAASEPLLKAATDMMTNFPNLRVSLALLYIHLSRFDDARLEFKRAATHGFADIRRDNSWMLCMAEASDVCAALDDRTQAAVLYPLLLPYAERNSVSPFPALSYGAMARSLGLLATVLKDFRAAEEHFDLALARNRALGARSWVARTQYDHAAMLCLRSQPGDVERASVLTNAAFATAESLGMQPLIHKIAMLGRNRLRVVDPKSLGKGTASVAAPAPRDAATLRCVFRCQGDYWMIVFETADIRLKDAKGVQYLAHLLRHPGQEFHVLALIDQRVEKQRPDVGSRGVPILDAAAKAAYRRRIVELDTELAEAEAFNDSGRVEQLHAEIGALGEQLAAAVGLGGRDRVALSATERARSTITHRIKTAIKRIAEHSPELADHLANRVKTGTFCVYRPDPTRTIEWIV